MSILQKLIEIFNEKGIVDVSDNSAYVSKTVAFACNLKAKQMGYHIQAQEKGAFVIFIDDSSVVNNNEAHLLHSEYTQFLQAFFPYNLKLFAVTGTNGKTSTVHFGAAITSILGEKSASVGTNGVCVYENGEIISKQNTGLTTATQTQNFRTLGNLYKSGVKYVFMEASSIGIHQKRLDGIKFDVTCFSNFTQDHLDYHHTMQEYFTQKLRLFTELTKEDGTVVLNAEDGKSQEIAGLVKNKTVFFGLDEISFDSTSNGIIIHFPNKTVNFHAFGKFQILNLLSVVKSLSIFGFNLESIVSVIPLLKAPSGRMEVFKAMGRTIIVDYAHTPDALENVLKSIDCKKILVFGCGGNRDSSKRPLMGKIASSFANYTILTNDNPRNENPEAIIYDITNGISNNNFEVMLDRKSAIIRAVEMCEDDCVVIVAGKGSEDYQEINGIKLPYSDIDVIKNL